MSKKQLTKYAGLSYRELQQDNRTQREQLFQDEQVWLKANGYHNVGWRNVIALFDKIQSLLEVQKLTEWSLEELFLEADRIGEKYQKPEEIEVFQAAMTAETEQISELIDRIFPDTEPEVLKFSNPHSSKKWRQSNQRKASYTVKI
jgi:hypothetical protein